MTENSKKVFECVKENQLNGTPVYNDVVAELTGLPKKTVDGAFTRSIQQKGLGYREEVEIEMEDGNRKKVKLFKLNDEGLSFDPDAE